MNPFPIVALFLSQFVYEFQVIMSDRVENEASRNPCNRFFACRARKYINPRSLVVSLQKRSHAFVCGALHHCNSSNWHSASCL
jgi:hypothetical protein